MASNSDDLTVRFRADIDDLKKGIDDAQKGISNFSALTVAKGILGADAIKSIGKTALQFGIDSVKAWGQSEQAMLRLTKAVGTDAAKAMAEYATQLQKTTTFSDDSIIAVQTQLAQYGVLPGSIKNATAAIVDYAAASGKDLPAAASVFTAALAGQDRELKKYGLTLEDGATRTQNLDRVTTFMTEKFQGSAAAMRGPVIGSLENLQLRLEDIQKKIGKELTPVVSTWVGWLEKAVEWVEKLTGASENDLSVRDLGIKKLQEEQAELKRLLQTKGEILQTGKGDVVLNERVRAQARERIVMVTRQISELKKQQAQETKTAEAAMDGGKGVIENTEEQAKAKQKLAKAEIAARKDVEAAMARSLKVIQDNEYDATLKTQIEYQRRMEAAANCFENQASFSQLFSLRMAEDAQSMNSIWVDTITSMRDSFASGMAEMIVKGGSFKDMMKEIGQQLLQEFIENVIKKMLTAWLTAMATMEAGSGSGNMFGNALNAWTGPGGGGAATASSSLFPGGVAAAPGGAGVGLGGVSAVIGAGLGAMQLSQLGEQIGGSFGGILANPIGYQLNFAKKFLKNPASVAKSIGKKVKKLFSGGILHEPTLMVGTESGEVGLAGEDGSPEALVSFREMGLSPAQGRSRLLGTGNYNGAKGGADGITINITGSFIEGDPAKWQRLIREQIVPQIRRYTMVNPLGPFARRRGAA